MDEQSIFLTALEKTTADERNAYLAEACGGDATLQQRITALIDRYNDAGSFLERPPSELDVTAVSADDTQEDRDQPSDVRTTLYDTNNEVTLDFLHPSTKPGCLGTIGQYEVQSVIGRGGMGVVLKAHDTRLHRTVAVKVLAPELAANPTAKQRFIREARAAAAVTNPHVVTTHAVDEDRVPYLVMELVDGKTLKEKIDAAGMLGVKEILRIGSQIAHGLAAAHKQGLIHRDIKPGNILLENGVERVKITDFGLARAVDDFSVTKTGEVAGTPQFMSPEQAMGEGVDHRSDLFSLGSVMYAMCTGRPPFRGDNAMAVLRRVIDEAPRPIREVNAEIPDWLIEIINKLLAKDPEQRFQTAKEVASVLEESLAGLQYPPSAPASTVVASPPLPAPALSQSRRKRLIASGIVGAVAVLTGIIIKITQPDGTTVEIEADPRSRIEISSDDDSEPREDHSHEDPADDDDGFPSGAQVDPAQAYQINFNGTWDSFWGPVEFTHFESRDGQSFELFGKYQSFSGDGEGEIHGTVDPATRTFTGRFVEAGRPGRLMLVISTDGQSIEGWYDYLDQSINDSQPIHEWDMTLRLAPLDFNGVWSSHFGPVTLRHAPIEGVGQVEMHGEYPPAASPNVIEGYIDPGTRMFKGRFTEAYTSGRVWLQLSREGEAIYGWYDYGDAPAEGERPTMPWNMTLATRLAPLDAAEWPVDTLASPTGSFAEILTSPDWEWTAAENLGPVINTSSNEGGPTITADGLTLIFHSDRADGFGDFDLWMCTRSSLDADWQEPVNLGATVNTASCDVCPSLSGDGLILVFQSGLDSDLWISNRSDPSEPWSAPVKLSDDVNSNSNDTGPALSADGSMIVFASDRNGEYEVFSTSRPTLESPWSPAQNLGRLSDRAASQGFAMLTSDGSLIFISKRSVGEPFQPLWIATRMTTTDPWSATVPPQPGEPVTGMFPSSNTYSPMLMYGSQRDAGQGSGDTDIWMTRRVRRAAAPRPVPAGSSANILTSDEWEWTEPENLGRIFNSAENEGGPSLTADGMTLVFHSQSLTMGEDDLWIATRGSTDQVWTATTSLGPTINSTKRDANPSISADGLVLVFESDRAGGLGDRDLWITSRPSRDDNWDTPVNLGEAVNSDSFDQGPALSPDGLTLIFATGRDSGDDSGLWETTRSSRDAPWSPARPLGNGINSSAHESWPTFTGDGLSLVFNSNREGGWGPGPLWISTRAQPTEAWSTPTRLDHRGHAVFSASFNGDGTIMLYDTPGDGGQGRYDIWMMRRVRRDGTANELSVDASPAIPSSELFTSDDWQWSAPENLGPVINSEAGEGGATLSTDSLTLVFDSDRGDGLGQFDLWISDRESVDADWQQPINLGPTVNSASHDATPCLSSDGLSLVFASDRPGGIGDHDLWMTTRRGLEEPWSTPVNLGEHVNSAGHESNPTLSADGLRLIYMSPREGESELWESSRPTTDAPWEPPRRLGIPGMVDAALSNDGLSLIYNLEVSDRNPGESPLWIATWSSVEGEWSMPSFPVDYENHEFDTSPCLSSEAQLFFTSHRPDGQGGFDLWMMRRVRRDGGSASPDDIASQDHEFSPIPIGESPLDQLDPAIIPEAEQFDWQPEELVAVIGSHARRHWYAGRSVAISPDGTQVATGDDGGVSILWDAVTQAERLRLPLLHRAPVLSLQFSPDGSRLVDNWGRVFDVSDTVAVPVPLADGAERFPCNAVNGGYTYFCEAGNTLLYCGTDGECVTFDFSALNPLPQAQLTIAPPAGGPSTHLVASEANELLYLATDGTWRRCRIQNQQFVDDAPFPVAMDPGDHVFGISPDGRRTAISKQGTMEMWDVAQSPPVLAIAYETAVNAPATFSADGRWMAVKYTSTFLYRTDSPETVAALDQTDRGATGSVVFSRDGNLAVVLNSQGFVRFWNLSGEEPTEFSPFDDASGFIQPSSHTSPSFVRGTSQIVLTRYDLGAGYFVRHQFWNLAGVFPYPTPDGETFLDAPRGYRVLPIDAEHVVVNFANESEGPPLRYRFDGIRWRPDGEPFGDAHVTGEVSRDGQFLVTLPRDTRRELVGWDLSTETPARQWTLPLPFNTGTHQVVQPLAMSANQQVLAVFLQPEETESGGSLVVLRNPTTEPSIAHTLPITSDRGRYRMAVSPDGRYIAHLQRSRMEIVLTDISGSEPSEVWHLEFPQYIHWLSYAPDGQHVAFGGNDGVGILEVPRMELVWEWEAPGPVNWVEWADDSRHLITHNGNKTVYVLRLNQLAD